VHYPYQQKTVKSHRPTPPRLDLPDGFARLPALLVPFRCFESGNLNSNWCLTSVGDDFCLHFVENTFRNLIVIYIISGIIVIYTISGIKALLQDSSVKIADDEGVSPSSSVITRVSCNML
jgi:hypothetical protein